jgi:hypothetical protein
MKCIVKGCTNHTHEGTFVGNLCKACHTMLSTGKLNPSNAWFVKAIEQAREDVIKDVTITSTTDGEDVILKEAQKVGLVTEVNSWSTVKREGLFTKSVIESNWVPTESSIFRYALMKYTDNIVRKVKEELMKDVAITSRTNGEVVAVTLTDEDYKIYKVLWTRES